MRLPVRSLLFTAMALCCGAALAASKDAVPAGHLPDWAVPKHYTLSLRVDPDKPTFSGRAQIKVDLKAPSDHVWLHGKALKVSRAFVTNAKGKRAIARYVSADEQAGVVRIDFGRKLEPQELTLDISYSAPFNQQLQGLYQVKYQGEHYAMTQMEPVSARFAFPSFDEPAFKTPYDLSITLPTGDKALANTAEISTKPAGKGWKTTTFATTLPLPTYLLAYGIGPWDVVNGPDIAPSPYRSQATKLRGVASKGQGVRMERALAQTPQMVHFLEDYYAFGYPFDKLDLVAAPDFSAGAMENPGFVTFRDWLLLLDENSPERNVRGSFNVTAHELAHMWTGDVVTMAWWDDLWLNESFATWMQQKVTMKFHPEYHADLNRITGAQSAMDNDALVSARKMRQPITGNGDIETAFDGITYQKGAAVLGMFEAFVGEETFQAGMRDYIASHQYANATADDLVNAITKASGKDAVFQEAFRSFLNQPGVPYLETALAREGRNTVLQVKQQRYLPLGSTGNANQTWGIPVCVKYQVRKGSETACELITSEEGRIVLPNAVKNPWVFPNAKGAGYYRFNLPHRQLAALGKHVSALDDSEQLAYADAIDAAFRRGDANVNDVLAAARALSVSEQPDVSTALVDRVSWVWRVLANSGTERTVLRDVVAKVFLPQLQALGYQRRAGESSDDVKLRSTLVGLLGSTLGVPEVRQALLAQGDAVLAGDGRPNFEAANPDLLEDVLSIAVQTHGQPVVDTLMTEFKLNGDASQRLAMLAALGSATDEVLLRQARDFALTDAVKVGEMGAILLGGHATASGHASMWPWFTSNFDAIVKRTGSFAGKHLPLLAASGGCTVEEAARLEAFFKPRLAELPGTERGLAQTSESIRLCAALKDKQEHVAISRRL